MPVYALGSNGSGQLAIDNGNEDVSIPTRCIFDGEVDNDHEAVPSQACEENGFQVAAGGNHTLLRLSSGHVYIAGTYLQWKGKPFVHAGPEEGGEVEACHTSTFKKLIIRDGAGDVLHDRFKFIAATWEASYLVCQDGQKIFVLGQGGRGVLGLGEGIEKTGLSLIQALPSKSPDKVSITGIHGAMRHIVCTLSNGEVWGWGSNLYHQLGADPRNSERQRFIWRPEVLNGRLGIIRSLPVVHQAAVGTDFTLLLGDDSLADATSKTNYCWLVLGKAKSVSIPPETSISLTDCQGISAGWSTAYVHRKDGRTLGWGANMWGQVPDAGIPRLESFAAGSEHTIGITAGDRKVIAFGWPEHGNCGYDPAKAKLASSRYHEIDVPLQDDEEVRYVGAGCATTFIFVQRRKA